MVTEKKDQEKPGVKKKSDARFKFVLSMDKATAMYLPWSHVRSRFKKLFNEQLPGLKPIIDNEIPKTSPSVTYTVEVKDKTQ